MSHVGERISRRREELGLSRDEVAQAVGITPTTYYDLEAYEDELRSLMTVEELGVSYTASLPRVPARELLEPPFRKGARGAAGILAEAGAPIPIGAALVVVRRRDPDDPSRGRQDARRQR